MIIDASVVIAALLADGSVRRALLHADVPLTAPDYLRDETLRKAPLLARRAGVPAAVLLGALHAFFDRIEFIPAPAYAHTMPAAQSACKAAHAAGDEDYVALALATGDAIWSLDRDFDRVKGIRCVMRCPA